MNTKFHYQFNAINKLSRFKVGALFMEQGTGKTKVALELIKPIKPDLIIWVGPLQSIKTENNMPSISDEINKWGGFECPIEYIGIESLQQSDRIFIELRSKIIEGGKVFLICDESIKIKNSEAKRTRRMLQLSELVEYKLILNGTPLSKNLLDLKAQMDFLSPKILNMSDSEYKNTFCEYTKITKYYGGKKAYKKDIITGFENIDYLHSLIKNYVFECNLELTISQYYNEAKYNIDEESINVYNNLKEKYLNFEMLHLKNNNIFLEMTQKMQHAYCCTPEKFDILNDYFKNKEQSKSIIFCKYIKSKEACEKFFKNATVLSYQKHSFSLNLQHLNNTIYFDKIWDWALRNQSITRTYRTGQEYDCSYLDLTGNVGLEKLIDENIAKKTHIIEYFKDKTREELLEVL